MIIIRHLDPGNVFGLLAERADLLERLAKVSKDRATVDAIVATIYRGGVDVWGLFDDEAARLVGLATSQIIPYAKGKVFKIHDVVTDSGIYQEHWPDLFAQLEDFARQIGADWIDFDGRLGWMKMAEAAGFKARRIIFTKEVTK
jgi:hypothetical protein